VLFGVEDDGAIRPPEVPALPGKPDMADRELGVSELGLDAVNDRRRGGRSRKAERQQRRGAGSEWLAASSESLDEMLCCASAACVDSPRAIPTSLCS